MAAWVVINRVRRVVQGPETSAIVSPAGTPSTQANSTVPRPVQHPGQYHTQASTAPRPGQYSSQDSSQARTVARPGTVARTQYPVPVPPPGTQYPVPTTPVPHPVTQYPVPTTPVPTTASDHDADTADDGFPEKTDKPGCGFCQSGHKRVGFRT